MTKPKAMILMTISHVKKNWKIRSNLLEYIIYKTISKLFISYHWIIFSELRSISIENKLERAAYDQNHNESFEFAMIDDFVATNTDRVLL